MKSTIDDAQRTYELDATIPIAGVVPEAWQDAILPPPTAKAVSALSASAMRSVYCEHYGENLRCKEIWVEGGNRYRNPEQDLPQDFEAKRPAYYQALQQPLDADLFIEQLQQQMTTALKATG